ncbi:pyridoxine/pyridoxamine 5'-phosphate oxidase 1, chloroplastic isoform X1 [Nicotiana tabacum]|uniref:NAD(P)H-hydrate epimerase n=2 Tax=Nicotiana TaxID=4085 RepID=A0A1S4D7L5_TOBAC|nr:PREDICTED: pyridoxine/pyridoxamine 5'-phosphate oxidase 1, chloroplastic-like isoform X1 [Nicotiana sylvestris]XP_016509351.1 PREDICTED: pyridoxine/pyridoxamine 5'-phosphate oxidase 1, chloroplastic-like isoform X1 [Nicotiana tabacum]
MEKSTDEISYVSQQEAIEIDEMLMGPLGSSVDQLMELAGLSVASAIGEVYSSSDYTRVLVICGPGNNGGDGLVAARHLHHFGYKPSICYPKRNTKPLFAALVTQLESLSIPFLSEEQLSVQLSSDYDIIVDAIFGFSFHGTPRLPFDSLIRKLVSVRNQQCTHQKAAVIISVDVPSGWHVEDGDVFGDGIKPDMLVSLTAPKLCAKMFFGTHHFLGGRFVPQSIIDKFKLKLPPYPGTSMCVRIGNLPQTNLSAQKGIFASSESLEEVEEDPIYQFQKWLSDALAAGIKEPHYMVLSTADKDAKPSSRMMSLEGVNKDGFVWQTNYGSRKAREILENPQASLLFYWGPLKRQVRVEGFVEQVSEEESEQYFSSLSRDNQIRPIVSKQSRPIHEREVLRQQYRELEEKYHDRTSIPRPKHWGGYRLIPEFFEFWQGEESQVHLKLRYSVEEIDGRRVWRIHRLVPQLAESASSL